MSIPPGPTEVSAPDARALQEEVAALRAEVSLLRASAAAAPAFPEAAPEPDAPTWLARTLEHAPGLLYVYDLDEHRNVYCNREVAAELGYTAAQLHELGDTLFAHIVHPDDLPRIGSHHAALRQVGQGETLELSYRMRRPDSTWRWFRSRDRAFERAPDGQVVRILGLAFDITAEVQAQGRLDDSERTFEALAATSVDFLYTTDLHGEISYCSRAVEPTLGYAAEELVGRNFLTLLDDASRQVAGAALGALSPGGGSDRVRVVAVHRDGHAVHLEVHSALVSDATGRPLRIQGVVRDISADQRLQQELRQHRAHLEALLAARTDDLGVLNRELQRKNEELEQLVYVTSHDLRSPLVNVQGFSRELELSLGELRELLANPLGVATEERLRRLLDEDVPESLQFILASVAKMDALLTALLRLSRVGRQPVLPVDLDMQALAVEVVHSMMYELVEAGCDLELGELPPCRADAGRMSQALSNLISNAAKFRHPGRPGRIRVSGVVRDGAAVYCVEDNGVGVHPDHQRKIFELFQRLRPAETPGDGLGLAIVKRVVERLGGAAWVESEPGAGARFYLRVPATQGA